MTAELTAQVCVVGGGPAGLTLAVELAKRSVSVVVLEQSGHFNRSFRGESVSPDSVWLLDRLGLLDRLDGTYAQMHHMEIIDSGSTVLSVDFSDFRYPHPYPVELPQPALLSALADAGREHPGFTLRQSATAVALLREQGDSGPVTGVRARTPDGDLVVRAALTVAADGRFSKVREMSGLPYEKQPLDRDVVWLRLPFPEEWDSHTYRIRIRGGEHGLFIPTHPDSVRVGLNIPKGGLKDLRAQGLGALHERLDRLAPELSTTVRKEVKAWSDTSMLDIFTTVVPRWSMPGLVLMGDAAHTLTPILGQGVNHAIIDAVTLAPLVGEALADDSAAALVRAGEEFQRSREEAVRRSRALQLRQERLFALDGRLGGLARRSLYRVVDRNQALQQKVLARAYFQVQEPGAPVAPRVVRQPASRP
ncbi:putative oxidoreductase [Streptomyces scabiei 87.22]|uniref:Putative oxidoreductase n=1 Tax=Streptomyces scabiei (strain 87.22) TaxID=680198 RepID=C9ZCE2_STRSW|nr:MULTISPECIES: FAD-dependent oxidoreductase [Streptomyces]MDW8472792.1 FAD-dependent oxidoreductase [Streptomyces scabiei]MDX2534217.1 FAD-dependent oxidoreductase [Streptomyces scabiei]MDX2571066.1 FAD-dependent oxidoreductase [Streptomyces scabiei]MDX2575667.1 FAD-dependent oxidoreductase [Streptomyces scabiei]MDX2630143.1 FAD-dependent oxidoreductase [Streptomyces scabiei]